MLSPFPCPFSLLASLFSRTGNTNCNKEKWKLKKGTKKSNSSFCCWMFPYIDSIEGGSRFLCHSTSDHARILWWYLLIRLMLEKKSTVQANISSYVLMGYTKQFLSQGETSLQNRSRWVISHRFRDKTQEVHSVPTTVLLAIPVHTLMTGNILHIQSPSTFFY